MIYRFVKRGENVIMVGDVDADALEKKFQFYLDSGYVVASVEEWVRQIIGGALGKLTQPPVAD